MAFSVKNLFRNTVAASALTVAFSASPLLVAMAQAETINGAGATFPQKLYEEYGKAYQNANKGETVNYQPIGSGGGIRQVIGGAVDFGGSDAAMTDDQMKEGKAGERGILLIPTAGGAVVPIYNLPGVSGLKLSRMVLPDIFAGKITKWNDKRIQDENPNAKLPDAPIKTVVRADSSGTTFIFTNHLSTISPYFKGRIGVGTAPKWTTDPAKERGNSGVAASVKGSPNSIGYVEYSFAKSGGLSIAQVQNEKGDYIAPSAATASEALESITFPDNFRVFEGNPKKGYPITGVTWMMVYRDYSKGGGNPAKGAAVKKWVKWVLTDGQNINERDGLDFAKVPEKTRQEALKAVESIK
jgi:phosphate transport system substrate-binding protein